MTRPRASKVTRYIIDFTNVQGPPAKPYRPTPPTEPPAGDPATRAAIFAHKLASQGREADERRKRRVQYEEDVASGKRKPFYRKSKIDPKKTTMYWLKGR